MALQTQDLVMVGLSVLGDSPPNAIQPTLADAIHLRWAFRRDLGFPWYGYYLYRRLHREGRPLCLSQVTGQLAEGLWSSQEMNTPYGRITSDRNLVLSDKSPPEGTVEFDLARRRYLRFICPPGEPVRRVEVRIGFRDKASIAVTAWFEKVPVVRTLVSGTAGVARVATLEFDAISAIELSAGPATLVDLCFVPVSQDATVGWAPVPDFVYPMSLPVSHPDYPCRAGPVNQEDSERLALGRLLYGMPSDWAGSRFGQLYDQILALVKDGPAGGRMAERSSMRVQGTPVPPASGMKPPTMRQQYPLDLVLLGALHPAIAQMVGLYWADRKSDPAVAYDYLILAVHAAEARGNPMEVLTHAKKAGFGDVDGYIVFNQKMASARPLAAPDRPRAFALPGGSMRTRGGAIRDASNNAGLRWDLGLTQGGVLSPGRPLIYHLWRADLGDEEPVDIPPIDRYRLITVREPNTPAPVLVAKPPDGTPERSPEWPPYPLHAMDIALPDGWYSYRVSGIDIFGRHSPTSAPAAWYQWTPAPVPRPWYYLDPDRPRETAVHPFAVRLLDKLPPPPPTAIEAYALDPSDPTVLKDAAYLSWWNALTASEWYRALSGDEQKNLIGLRVRWQWTHAHMRQAPDTREFRIYYQPGSMNAVLGRTRSVSIASSTESTVETDIVNIHATDAYVGAWLRIGSDSFPIVASDDATPLRVTVRSGPVHSAGTISAEYRSATVTGVDTHWSKDFAGLKLQVEGEPTVYTVLYVNRDTQQLTLNRGYAGATGVGKAYAIRGKLPQAGVSCTLEFPAPPTSGTVSIDHGSPVVTGNRTNWGAHLVGLSLRVAGEQTTYTILQVDSVDSETQQLTLDRGYGEASVRGGRYTIRHRLSVDYSVLKNWQTRYFVVGYEEHMSESLLPATVQGEGEVRRELRGMAAKVVGEVVSLDGAPDLSGIRLMGEHLRLENDKNRATKAYRITAVDDGAKIVAVDGTPNIGGEPSPWVVGYPLRSYEVFLPGSGHAFRNGLPLIPSLAEPIVYAHVGVSAADNKTHTLDDPKWDDGRWGGRFGNEGRVGPPAKLFRVLRERPRRPIIPPADSDRVYATAADYHGRSFYTYRWHPRLPEGLPEENLKVHIFRALDETLFQIDWKNQPRAVLEPEDPNIFPDEILSGRRPGVVDELNALRTLNQNGGSKSEALVLYRKLTNDALRVLAGLSGNERAFTQITIQPLDPEEPDQADPTKKKWRDLIGPDTDPEYEPSQDLRAYVDTLDGRSTNRYFYRASYVDKAHNRSYFSLSSPPVYLPNVVPPRAPVITKVLGDARQITLKWAANREPDLAWYRVYRADNKESARDLRLMTLVYTEGVPAGDPATRPAEVEWSDGGLVGGSLYYYRLVAVDEAGNVSAPSHAVKIVVVDTSVPEPPIWMRPIWVLLRDSDGGEEAWPADGIIGEGRHPALRLLWTSDLVGARFVVTRRARDERAWRPIVAGGAYQEIAPGRYLLYDTDVSPVENYSYRIRVTSATGVSSIEFREIEAARPR